MAIYSVKPCPCGSGKESQWECDGNGIPLCRTCDDCHEQKMSRYRPEILRPYTQADVDEQIEEDKY